jgi:hypothetical protein
VKAGTDRKARPPASSETKAKISAGKKGKDLSASQIAQLAQLHAGLRKRHAQSEQMRPEVERLAESFSKRLRVARSPKQRALVQDTFKAVLANLSSSQVKLVQSHLRRISGLKRAADSLSRRDQERHELVDHDWR